jgi:hypothetical protein
LCNSLCSSRPLNINLLTHKAASKGQWG